MVPSIVVWNDRLSSSGLTPCVPWVVGSNPILGSFSSGLTLF